MAAVIARRGVAVVAVLLLVVALTGCSGASTAHQPTASVSGTTLVVGLGDSVPAAAGCNCTSFVEIYGNDVQKHTGRANQTDNFAKNGLTTEGLISQLGDRSVAEAVARADLITITIGANDFSDAHDEYATGTCGGSDGLACVQDKFPILRSNFTEILDKFARSPARIPWGYA